MSEASGARRRPYLAIVLAALVVSGACSLWASGLTWAVYHDPRTAPLPPVSYALTGTGAVPMVPALGVVALAAVLAVLATRLLGRRIIAIALIAVAAWTAVQFVQFSTASDEAYRDLMTSSGTKGASTAAMESATARPAAVIGIVAALAAGGGLLVMAHRLPSMGSKYDRDKRAAAKVPADPAERDRELWKSLDSGDDPTA